MAKVLSAVLEHGMLSPGDRVLVGLSGGKDSLALLHCLGALQRMTPFEWDLGACTVDPGALGYDPAPLVPYLESLGVPYWVEKEMKLMEMAQDCMANTKGNRPSICSYCSRMKRGLLYACMRREGYTVLALGQHLDDLAESFLMSALHNGALRSIKAHYRVDQGDLRVVRPLAYAREADTDAFAERCHLPVVNETCPACFEAPKERFRMKALLASQEALYPNLFSNLRRTLLPLLDPRVEDYLRIIRESYGAANRPLNGSLKERVNAEPPLTREGGGDQAAGLAGRRHHGAWEASIDLCRRRGGGRGCSQREERSAGTASPASTIPSRNASSNASSNASTIPSSKASSNPSSKASSNPGGKAGGKAEGSGQTGALSPESGGVGVLPLATKVDFDKAIEATGGRKACEGKGCAAGGGVAGGGGPLVLVAFKAEWCAPCRRLAPALSHLALEACWRGRVHFRSVDLDENGETAQLCGVAKVPTFQLYRAARKVHEISGEKACWKLRDALEELL